METTYIKINSVSDISRNYKLFKAQLGADINWLINRKSITLGGIRHGLRYQYRDGFFIGVVYYPLFGN